jgi:RNA polymerase sigma-70 factor (ECF subfamily)
VSNPRAANEELARVLYYEHGADLLWFVQRRTRGDQQLAEDIVQETVLRAWRHADDLPPTGAMRAWLFTTAHRLVIDAYRARTARPAEISGDRLDAVAGAADLDEALDTVVIADALGALTPAHRAALIAFFYRGRTATEIATEHRIPPGTARSRIHYGLRALRRALQERGVLRR